MTFRQFADKAKLNARMVGRSFTEPDDDWAPVAMLEIATGQVHVILLTPFFVDSDTKDVLTHQVLPALIQDTGARKLALVLSAWMAARPEHESEDEFTSVRPSERPDRQEILQVVVYDAERVEWWAAPIERHRRKPPSLGAWRDPGLGEQMDGRFITPIAEALR